MTTWYLLATLALLFLNGFFVAAEFAVIAAQRARIEAMAGSGSVRARAAKRSLRELSLMLTGAQFGITAASLGLGSLAEPAVARLLEGGLTNITELPEGVVHSLSFVIALTIVVFFHMVIGEMAPKNVAIAVPEQTLLQIALPFRFFITVFRPLINLLNRLATGFLNLFGVESQDEITTSHSTDDIADLIRRSAGGGMIEDVERRLLSGAAGFSEKDAAGVMIPRTEMVALPIAVAPVEIEKEVVRTGHSRFPLYGNDLDDIHGFFHSKDLLKIPTTDRRRPLARKWVRSMLVVPENRKLHPLMVDMRREQQHFALVVDEHGGTAGMVTLEDILEELVGDIRDEYDAGPRGIEELGEGKYLVPGTLPLYEAEELGLELPDGEYETVAGFLMDQLGRIPKRRDVVDYEGWRLRVLSMHRRKVLKVVIEKVAP